MMHNKVSRDTKICAFILKNSGPKYVFSNFLEPLEARLNVTKAFRSLQSPDIFLSPDVKFTPHLPEVWEHSSINHMS